MLASPAVESEHPVLNVQAPDSRSGAPWRDIASLAVVLVFALALCRPILSGKVPIAADTLNLWSPWAQQGRVHVRNTTLADSALLYLSWETFSRNAISDGEWPLWDPYSFSGFPFAANSQNQVYYPVTWLLWLLPLSGALQLLALFNICLAGWGMYFFCRVLGTGRAGALLAGLAFCGSGILQTALELPGVASVYGWLPWMLLTADLALRYRSGRWTAAAGLCCGLQLVAGHLQWAIYAYFTLGCWLLVRSVQISLTDKRRRPWRSLAGSLVRSGSILAWGVALALVHLAPFLELTALSSRGGVRVSSNNEPLVYMLRSLLPSFFGTPLVVPDYPLMFNNLWYVGIAPLLLAVVGLALGERLPAFFWGAMALLAVLVTFGIGPFLYVRWLPGLQATLPNRIGFLFVAGLCVLAALGTDAWLRLAVERTRLGLLLLIALAVALGATMVPPLTGWLSSSDWVRQGFTPEFYAGMEQVQKTELLKATLLGAASLAALALVLLAYRGKTRRAQVAPFALVPLLALDLLLAIPGYNSYVDPADLKPGATAIRWLRQQPGQWRMMPITEPGAPPTFVPNSQLIFSLPSVDGYDSLHNSRYDDFWGLVDATMRPQTGSSPYNNVFVLPQAYSSTLASLLNVKYVVTAGSAPLPGLHKVYGSGLNVFENPGVLPKAFIVGRGQSLPPAQVLQRMGAPDFDPRNQVFVEGNNNTDGDAGPPGLGEATITSYKRNSVDVRADVSGDAYLVLADASYPGWHVSVDGVEKPLLTADYILRSVRLSRGVHTVHFWFLPSFFAPTLALSAASLLLAIFVLIMPVLANKRRYARRRLSAVGKS